MFMIVSYPRPVASAHIQLPGPPRQAPDRTPQDQDQPVTEPEQRRILLAAKA